MNHGTTTLESPSIGHETQNVSEAVVDAVADAKGVSTLEVHPPLYEAIDPDALDEIVTSMDGLRNESAGHIAFRYSGYEVVVSANDGVSVAEIEPQE